MLDREHLGQKELLPDTSPVRDPVQQVTRRAASANVKMRDYQVSLPTLKVLALEVILAADIERDLIFLGRPPQKIQVRGD